MAPPSPILATRWPLHWFVCWQKNKKSNFGFGLWEVVLPDLYLISAMANWLPASENVIFYPYEASKLWLIWKILQKWHFLTTIFVLLSKILRVRESTWVSSSELMWDTIIYPVEGSQAVRIGARPKNVTFFGGVNRGNKCHFYQYFCSTAQSTECTGKCKSFKLSIDVGHYNLHSRRSLGSAHRCATWKHEDFGGVKGE